MTTTIADVYRYVDNPPDVGAEAPTFVDVPRDWAVRVVVSQHYDVYPDQSLPEAERADIVADFVAEPTTEAYYGRAQAVTVAGALDVARGLLDRHTTLSPASLDRGGLALFSDGKLARVDVETDIVYPDGVAYVYGYDRDDEAPVIFGGVMAIAELTPVYPRPSVVAVPVDTLTGTVTGGPVSSRPIANAERDRR